MRRAFFETLASIAAADPRVVLLTADLGYMAIEEFSERCPRQFFNAGVSEQNMIGMATGLAEAGFVPFVYSIAPFVVLRAYEFIRNGPVAHRSAVRLVSVGAGFDYGTNGISHYGIDDIGVLRVQPGFMLLTPADTPQARAALLCTWSLPGPLYFRLSKRDTVLPGLEARFALGHTQTLRSGTDVLLVGLGTAAQEALDAAEQLARGGISAAVELVDHLNGPPLDGFVEKLARFRTIVSVEAHYVNGGLGSMISELVAEHGLHSAVLRCGIDSVPDGYSGSQAYFHRRFGIDAASIVERVTKALG